MTKPANIVIIGAGPYGLSIAAHLRARGTAFRIFGTPMRSWSAEMPKHMLLKSEGFATNLSDPNGRLTLKQFCADNGLALLGRGISDAARDADQIRTDLPAAIGAAGRGPPGRKGRGLGGRLRRDAGRRRSGRGAGRRRRRRHHEFPVGAREPEAPAERICDA